MKALSESVIIGRLAEINKWSFANNSLIKEFQLENFSDALAFVVKVGLESEKIDHHPDMLLYGWNKVRITLVTHSAGGVTEKDFNLANKINQINL